MEDHEKHAKWLLGRARDGQMSRREFLGRTSALGMTLSAGAGLFSKAHAATPKRGGHMRIGLAHGSTADTLDPATLTNGMQWLAAYGVANTLTELDADNSLVPSLATEWSSSPDATVWTFKLRSDVEFHNGKSMTSEDVIASINYHRGEKSTSVGKPVIASIVEAKADGPHAVVFTLDQANADFPFNFNEAIFGIYPAKDDGIDWKAGGSGGYILKNEQPGRIYEFERNPNYWKEEAAHADMIDVLSIKDPSARVNALTTGDVDVVDRIEPKVISFLSRNADLVIEEGTGPMHYNYPMRTSIPPYDNPELRKALKFAIDRQEMLDKILFGHGTIGNDNPIGPSYRYYAEDIEQNSYDPDKARHHWKKSGLGDITLNLSAADAAYTGALDAAVLYQAAAKKAGIDIQVVREPNDGYWSNVWMKEPWCAAYWGGYATEDNMFTTGYAPDAAWNDTEWDNERFNKLLVAGRGELNEARRSEMYREMQILLRDKGGAVIPIFANEIHARNNKVAHGDLSWSRGLDGRRIMDRWWMT